MKTQFIHIIGPANSGKSFVITAIKSTLTRNGKLVIYGDAGIPFYRMFRPHWFESTGELMEEIKGAEGLRFIDCVIVESAPGVPVEFPAGAEVQTINL